MLTPADPTHFHITEDPRRTLATFVRKLRKQADLTKKDLADKLAFTPGYISMIEKASRCPDKEEFPRKLAHLFGETENEICQIEQIALIGIILYHFPEASSYILTQGEYLNPAAKTRIENDIEESTWDMEYIARQINAPSKAYLICMMEGQFPIAREQIYQLAKIMNIAPQEYLLLAGFIPYETLEILKGSPQLLKKIVDSSQILEQEKDKNEASENPSQD